MIRSQCCGVFLTSAPYAVTRLAGFYPRTGAYPQVIADGARFFSGCGDKAAAAAKASRGGEAPFRSKLQPFVLVLKTLRPASLAIRRGDGQHRILLFFSFFFSIGGDVFMKNPIFTNTSQLFYVCSQFLCRFIFGGLSPQQHPVAPSKSAQLYS